jgi:hypothetical protein
MNSLEENDANAANDANDDEHQNEFETPFLNE